MARELAGLWECVGTKKESLMKQKKSLDGGGGRSLVAPGVAARLKGMLQDWGQMCMQLC